MLSPYHRFWFSPGFELHPHSQAPSSEKLILQFDPSSTSSRSESDGSSSPAKIGVGAQKSTSCFSFSFYGSELGCKSNGPDCVFNITGLRYDYESRQERTAVSHVIQIPACHDLENCKLVPTRVAGFEHLTSVLISMTVDGEETPWLMDNLSLGWSDNTCDTAACRSTVNDTVQKHERDVSDRKICLRRRVLGFF